MYSYPWSSPGSPLAQGVRQATQSSPGSPLAQGVRQASREGGVALISQTVNNLSVIDVTEQLFN